jgi:Ca2+-binding EF-hand superfamily protein
LKDLKRTLEREGRVLVDINLENIFKEIDENKDGKIDFADFCRMMHQDLNNEQFLLHFDDNYASPTKPTLK